MSSLLILSLVLRIGLPIAEKLGWINEAEVVAIRSWLWAKKNIKTYPEYPTGKNGQSEAVQPAAESDPVPLHNYTSGQHIPKTTDT